MWEFVVKGLEASTLFLLPALGELINQRSGVLNVGLEGLMLFGAATSFITSVITRSLLAGFLAGMAIGGALGLIHGFLSISLKVNQVISGVGIWIFALGLTTYLAGSFAGPLPLDVGRPGTIAGISYFFYIGIALVFVIWFILFKTSLGLRIRSVGEDPLVAEVSGINVERTRYLCVTLGGILGGLGGAFYSLSYTCIWDYNVTLGNGWFALALVFFSMWNPWILLGGALLFGITWQFALTPELILPALVMPYYFYRMLPFALTIVVLAIISTKRFRAKWGLAKPAALGLPYTRARKA